jgi:hypothetical protein
MRLVLVPYTFGDGTVVPPGTMVASPTWCHHLDGGLYDDPRSFDPWRFVPAAGAAGEAEAEEESEKAPARERESRKAFTTTDLQYIPFGHGTQSASFGRLFVLSFVSCREARMPGKVLRWDRTQDNARPRAPHVRPQGGC